MTSVSRPADQTNVCLIKNSSSAVDKDEGFPMRRQTLVLGCAASITILIFRLIKLIHRHLKIYYL